MSTILCEMMVVEERANEELRGREPMTEKTRKSPKNSIRECLSKAARSFPVPLK
jgi:hypothetical protein